MPQISCTNLTLGYEGTAVLSELSFEVSAGDYLCIVGENGSGKSTLMKAILGLKSLQAGNISRGDGLGANEIGYIPQLTAAQMDFPASVREIVRSGCLNRCGLRPYYSTVEKHMAEENMEKLGITALAKSCYRELSGGQQRRVLLARALCATQKVLLLDEPAAGLDPGASEDMYALIKYLNDSGITIIMISHDIASSVKYASHILHVGQQTALFSGATGDYLKSDVGRFYARLGNKQVHPETVGGEH
jgi:zinc transport system ATP-binding protein